MKPYLSAIFLCFALSVFTGIANAQYPPPAGQPGTTAMQADSTAFINWASSCTITRGFINISDTTVIYNGFNKASYGSFLYATGPADELVVSLGDRGVATLGFDIPIVNRAGPDFAVFENGFGDSFLELGFVEASSDGQRYVRFPAVTMIPPNKQVNTFDTIDAVKIHNFAGKYRHSFGTPFDLEDLKDSAGIDLQNVTTIRIIDVVGCIKDAFSSYDSQGHKVNDPWPTPFDTGGFDLDGVGVIHNRTEGVNESALQQIVHIFPNPARTVVAFTFDGYRKGRLILAGSSGNILESCPFDGRLTLDVSTLKPGIYLATLIFEDGRSITEKLAKY